MRPEARAYMLDDSSCEPDPLPPPPDVDSRFDQSEFSDEDPTPTEPMPKMDEILEELRSPGIMTSTSERPTRPIRAIRPATYNHYEDQ